LKCWETMIHCADIWLCPPTVTNIHYKPHISWMLCK
jgi:hypothetical protein